MSYYKVTFSNSDVAYVNAHGVSDAIAEAEYQFGSEAVDAEIAANESDCTCNRPLCAICPYHENKSL